MTDPQADGQAGSPADTRTWTVGQVAETFGVTVRTLHHYDEIGLLSPSERSRAGYRLYTQADIERLGRIVVYRRLELPLEQIAAVLDDGTDPTEQLRRQREAILTRLDELHELVGAIDAALERHMTDQPATTEDLKEMFGDGYGEEYAAEAQARWGETDAWKQSKQRTSRYTKADWESVKAEQLAVGQAFVAALQSGAPPTSEVAMDAAELHRRSIHRFYDCSYAMQRGLADMYIADPRFTKTYEDMAPGLAAYVRDAIHANADRHEA